METLQSELQFDSFDPTRAASAEVKPPFPYIEFNWHNGFASADKTGGAKYFGGWQISEENAGRALGTFGKVYSYFGEMSMWAKGKGDGEYPARSTRFITAVPIATRAKWYDGREGYKGSTKTQVLVYLCEIDKSKTIVPYGAGLINGGSYHSGKAISEAFQAWSNHVNTHREEAAIGNIPAWAFWGYFGTFGDKRITREVGSGEKNIVVPCQVNVPKEVASIRSLYVGDGIASEVMQLRTQAQAWLDDAKAKKQDKKEESNPFGELNADDDFPAP